MARRASKRQMLPPQVISPTRGVNYGVAPVSLSEEELARSMNGYYPKQSNRWTVRPGFCPVTSAANKLGVSITEIVPYYNGTTQYIVAASGGKLWQMTLEVLEGLTPAWTEVGALTDSTTKPSILTFNGLCLIADGGTSVRYWNGSIYGTIANSPEGCTALIEARNRVVGNSSVVYDYVYISAPEFPGTDWNYNSGALEIPAGFGDGIPVNGFALGPGGMDVIVSKRNSQQEEAQLRRLIMSDPTPSNWYVSDPTEENTGSQNAHGMLSAFGRTYYFDDVGIRAVGATDTYAEIQPDPHYGKRLNKALAKLNAVVSEITFLPTLGAFMILIKSHPQQYLYFPRNDAFCPWRMSGVVINSVCTIGGVIYMAGDDGNLYKMTEDISTDQIEPDGADLPIQSYGRSKKIVSSGYDMLLKRTTVALTPIKSGTMALRAVLNDEATHRQIGQDFELEDGVTLLGLATNPLGEATGKLGQSGAEPTQKTIHGGARSKGLQIEWYGNGCRYELEFITAEIAGPLGG